MKEKHIYVHYFYAHLSHTQKIVSFESLVFSMIHPK